MPNKSINVENALLKVKEALQGFLQDNDEGRKKLQAEITACYNEKSLSGTDPSEFLTNASTKLHKELLRIGVRLSKRDIKEIGNRVSFAQKLTRELTKEIEERKKQDRRIKETIVSPEKSLSSSF